ncbi:MAG TPA: hypothetical protein VFJ50_00720 [Gemmatimonadales bacterium]|nr:hypothetical protein [Gemmatimonadales bacterium]
MQRERPCAASAAEAGDVHSPAPGRVGGLEAFADALDLSGEAAALDARILVSDAWTDAA